MCRDIETAIVRPRVNPFRGMPEMDNGVLLIDGGALVVDESETASFRECGWLRPLATGKSFLYGQKLWMLHLYDVPAKEIAEFPAVAERVEMCRQNRLRMSYGREFAEKPAVPRDRFNWDGAYIAVPQVSSENREWIPVGLMPKGVVPNHMLYCLKSESMYHFGLMQSKAHNAWTRTVSGTLEASIRYSARLCWNTFPFPEADSREQAAVAELAESVIAERGTELCLAELYSDRMPERLREAHRSLDEAVDRLYGMRGKDRFSMLLRMHLRRLSQEEE